MRKIIFAVALLSGAAPAMAADGNCARSGRDTFKFIWTAASEEDPAIRSLRIVQAASGKTVQVLRNVRSDREGDWTPELRDYNNDGCADLKIVTDVAGIGNESSEVLLYDRARRRFVPNKALSGIGGLALDSRDRNCVTGSWKSGAASFYSSRHCWSKGKLQLVREETVDPVVEDDAVKCYQNVVHTYSRGRKRTTSRCDKDL